MDRIELPWPEEYRPTSVSQLVGNNEAIGVLLSWLESWKRGIPQRRAALLIGPPGVGKTASVGALANDLSIEVVEFNASDDRNKSSIELQVWRASTQETLDGRRRIVFLDEVDGLSGTADRGGVSAIVKVIKETVHPIVMTANNPDSPRLKDLLKICQVITFTAIEPEAMFTVLNRILEEQGRDLDKEKLEEIVENSGGDLRAAIADLETLLGGSSSADSQLVHRDRTRTIEEILRKLVMSTDAAGARKVVSGSDADYDQLLLWLDENVHLHLSAPDELRTGYDVLSLADLAMGRIFRQQNWKLLAYVYDFLSIGVSASRTRTPYRRVDYSEPTWPLLVWQGNRRRDKKSEMLMKLSSVAGVSRRRVVRTHLDTLESIISRDPREATKFANWLDIKKGSFDRKRNR
ncbi:MAG: replication factor C large subunit [Candidatus Thorarchaeota archaeon]|nr:MAG: replication factor C large subunit [Candidatus Thorarchaeota archaeon]